MSDLRECYLCGQTAAIFAEARSMGVVRHFCASAVTDSCFDQLRAAVIGGTHTAMGDPVQPSQRAGATPITERVPYSPRGRS